MPAENSAAIGATTLDEYRKHIEKDAALERRFQPVLVNEPTVEDTIAILRGLKERYEVHHGVRIQDSALVAAAMLSHRYIADRFLPDKAIDLIDEAASRLRMETGLHARPRSTSWSGRSMQLEIEQSALKKEKDEGSQRATEEAGEGTRQSEGEARRAQGAVAEREGGHQCRQHSQQQIEQAKLELEQAQRRSDLEPRRANPVRPPAGAQKKLARREGTARKACGQAVA